MVKRLSRATVPRSGVFIVIRHNGASEPVLALLARHLLTAVPFRASPPLPFRLFTRLLPRGSVATKELCEPEFSTTKKTVWYSA